MQTLSKLGSYTSTLEDKCIPQEGELSEIESLKQSMKRSAITLHLLES
jgi:hypothetical protein